MPLLRYWYYAVPPVYLAVILWLQPTDRMIMPLDENPSPNYPLTGWATRLVTDDGDTIAYGIRAENAARGRKAGLIGWDWFGKRSGWRYPTNREEEFEQRVAPYEPVPTTREAYEELFEHPQEFRERYFQEYPPLALYLFRAELIGAAGDGAEVHAAILDEHQYYVGCHVPSTPGEVTMVARFRHVARMHAIFMTLAQLGLMLLLDFGFPRPTPTWLLVLPGFLYFTPCRFDILPAMLVTASILAADKRRVAVSGLCLGLAVAFKMYPLVIAPILLRFTARSWKDAFVWCACAAVPMVVSYAAVFATDGVTGATVPLKFQLARDFEPQWCFYGKVLPPDLAFLTQPASGIRTAIPLVVSLLLTMFRPPDVFSLLRRCVVALIIFLTVSVFYSPQWWQWLAVLLVPLAARHRRLVWVIVLLDLWTYLHFPLLYDLDGAKVFDVGDAWTSQFGEDVKFGAIVRITHVWVRAAVWLGLAAVLTWIDWRATFPPRRREQSPVVISRASATPVASP